MNVSGAARQSPLSIERALTPPIAWTLIALAAGTTLIVAPDAGDSTILKAPVMILLTVVLLGAAAMECLARSEMATLITPIHLALGSYVVVAALSLLTATNLTLGLENLAYALCLLTIFWAASSLDGPTGEKNVVNALLIIASIVSAVALLMMLVPLPFIRPLVSPDRGTISTLGNATYLAGYFVLLLPLVIGRILRQSTGRSFRLFMIVLAATIVYLLIKTEARSSWIGALVGLLCMIAISLRSRRARWIGAGALLACVVAAALFFPNIIQHRLGALIHVEPSSSVARRLYFYRGAIGAFQHSPILGNGIGNFTVVLPKFRPPDYWMARSEDVVPHAHSELLETLAETGALGAACLVTAMALFTLAVARGLRQRTGDERIVLSAYTCSIIGVLVDGLWSMNLRTIPVAVSFWMLVGLSMPYLVTQRTSIRIALPGWMRRFRFPLLIASSILLLWYIPLVAARYSADRSFLEGELFRGVDNTVASAQKFSDAVALNPRHAEARFYLATDLLKNAQIDRAIDEIDTLLNSYPYYPKARLVRALAFSQVGDTVRAWNDIGAEIALDGSPQVAYYAATIALHAGDNLRAFDYIRLLLGKNIASGFTDYAPEGIGLLSWLCREGSHGSECSGLLWEAERAFPSNAPVLAAIGSAYLNIDDTKHARSVLTQAEQLAREDRRLHDHIEDLLRRTVR